MAAAGGKVAATHRLYRIRKTTLQMLANRGYEVVAEELTLTFDDFVERYPTRASMELLVNRRDDANAKLIVFFPEEDLGVKETKPYIERMSQLDAKRGIIVFSGRFSNLAKTLLAEIAPAMHVEHFRDEELLVDITEHELVPAHVLLTDDEKAALLARYKLKEMQLPRIQFGDPVARYYGMQRGQVVKITRNSETAGRYVTYRIVV